MTLLERYFENMKHLAISEARTNETKRGYEAEKLKKLRDMVKNA